MCMIYVYTGVEYVLIPCRDSPVSVLVVEWGPFILNTPNSAPIGGM